MTGWPFLTGAEAARIEQAAASAAAPVAAVRRLAFVSLTPDCEPSGIVDLVTRALASSRSGRIGRIGMTASASSPVAPVPTAPRAMTRREARAHQSAGAAEGTGSPDSPAGREQAQGIGGRSPSGAAVPPALERGFTLRDGVWTAKLADLADGRLREGADAAAWFRSAAPLAKHFDVLATDWGCAPGPQTVLDAASTAHAVCIVAPASRAPAERAVAVARSLHDRPSAPAVTVAFVDLDRSPTTWATAVARAVPFPTVLFPYATSRTRGAAGRSRDRPSGRTARATLVLAGALMDSGASARPHAVTPARTMRGKRA